MLKKILILNLLIFSVNSVAFDYIVFDPENLAEAQEQFRMLEKQLTELKEHKEKLETQIKQLDDHYQAITGKNDFNRMFEHQDAYGNLFFDWNTTLDNLQKAILENGGGINKELAEKIDEYNDIYGVPHNPDFYVPHEPNSYSAQWQAEQALTVREGMGTSAMAFDKAEGVNDFIKERRSAAYNISTQKEAIDYSNNVQLYMISIMNEIMRLQAQQLRLMSVAENETSQINDFNSKFFNTNFIDNRG